MKIEGREVNLENDYLGPVTYIPNHAQGRASHVDCEQGSIINIKGDSVMVLYRKSRTVQATNPSNLVWG